MLAAMFITIAPSAGWPAGTPGKSRRSKGAKARPSSSTAPPRSPMRMMPSQRQSTPVRPMAISKAVLAMSKVLATIACHTSGWPRKSDCTPAVTNAARKKKAQMRLSMAPG